MLPAWESGDSEGSAVANEVEDIGFIVGALVGKRSIGCRPGSAVGVATGADTVGVATGADTVGDGHGYVVGVGIGCVGDGHGLLEGDGIG